MRGARLLVLVSAMSIALVSLAGTASAHDPEPGPVGPPAGVFYADDAAYRSVVTPAHVPDKGPFDALYVFPDCGSCAPVSDAAPGVGNYNGGRWKMIQAFGITSQLTNADDVLAEATSLVDTGHRFVCPLIRAA